MVLNSRRATGFEEDTEYRGLRRLLDILPLAGGVMVLIERDNPSALPPLQSQLCF